MARRRGFIWHRQVTAILAIQLVGLFATNTFGWGSTGHSFLTQNAVQHVPAALQTFINRNFSTVSNYATNEPAGRHYIDIDVYPEFFAHNFPRDLNTLYAAHGTSFVNSNGISPWVISNYRTTLTSQMLTARTAGDLEAFARTAGEMAHYIEDINQPLHTTDNYDGQQTGNSGIHSRYETTMVNRNLSQLAVSPAPQNCIYVNDTVDWILDSIEDRTWNYVDDIMTADTLARTFGSTSSNAYYNSLWTSTGAFTDSQFQIATEMVASAWYSAWIDAGSPALSISGDYNNDGKVDAADYVVWRDAMGTSVALPNDLSPGTSPADYTEWRSRFGQSLSSGGAAVAATVPEPASLLIAIVGLVLSQIIVGSDYRGRGKSAIS